MRICLFTAVACMLAAACTTDHPDSTGAARQGLAEIQVDAGLLGPFGITRVTAEAAGVSQDLVLNEDLGSLAFTGIIILPAGTQTLVVSAFAGDTKIGQSQPTPVEVVGGVVTRVFLRILDLRASGAPSYGPILDSLSFPTTTEVGTTATFAISVVAPVGDPITYAWTSDCADATFTAPDAATTGWSKAAPGVCTINVQATSNGFTVARSFLIIVFPANASGALDVVADFVTAPSLGLRMGSVGCFDFQAENSSCPTPIASPDTSSYDVEVFNWGLGSPGTFEVSDNCGGRFGATFRGLGSESGSWLPPVGGGVCIVTARAVSDLGAVATRSRAIFVRPGTVPVTQPPAITVLLDNVCLLTADTVDCGSVFGGRRRSLFGSVDWLDGLPGSLTVEDSCAGPQPVPGTRFISNAWTVPNVAGTCITTVHATNLQGASSEVSAQYQVIVQ